MKEEREARLGLLGLKASGVLESIANDFVEKLKIYQNALLALTCR